MSQTPQVEKPLSKPRNLTCTCCGGSAGRWQQHWNQDTGYGLCASCRDWIWSRNHGDTREHFERTYGKPGVNFESWPEVHEAAASNPTVQSG
jgi:hypothetical protein